MDGFRRRKRSSRRRFRDDGREARTRRWFKGNAAVSRPPRSATECQCFAKTRSYSFVDDNRCSRAPRRSARDSR